MRSFKVGTLCCTPSLAEIATPGPEKLQGGSLQFHCYELQIPCQVRSYAGFSAKYLHECCQAALFCKAANTLRASD
jgi:hypothetical protein